MNYTDHLTSVLLILIVSSSLINLTQSSEAGNWLTKSLDYYSLEKCSSLEKSGITGDFHGCMNSPVETSSSTGSVNNNQGKWKSPGFGKFGLSKGSAGFGGFSGQSGFGKSSKTQKLQSPSADSWPVSLIDDLQHMINCFPKLIKPCMTESEVNFFTTIKNFFQAQVDYAKPNASLIATKITSSKCVSGNSIDSSTICYSTNIHKQNWFGWKINWADGQMCRFIDDISDCETSSYDKCPSDVKQFVSGLRDAGLQVTPCLDQTDATTTSTISTTTSSPSPVTGNPEQPKIYAPGSSVFKVDTNQLPATANITNINSNDPKSLEVNVANLTVNTVEEIVPQNQEDTERSKTSSQPSKGGFFDRLNENDDVFNGSDEQQELDDNNENEEDLVDDGFDYDSEKKDFKGQMKHSKRVRLHEVEGEGESRHDFEKRHRDVAEERWSRIKEEFRKKMRESIESRESDESEYEDESEESDEDKDFDMFEDRKKPFGPKRRNEEDDYAEKRRNRKDRKVLCPERIEEQRRKRREDREHQRKEHENEARRRHEFEDRKHKAEEVARKRRGEAEQRKSEMAEKIREAAERKHEEEKERRDQMAEKMREAEERRREEDEQRRDEIEERKRQAEERRREDEERRQEEIERRREEFEERKQVDEEKRQEIEEGVKEGRQRLFEELQRKKEEGVRRLEEEKEKREEVAKNLRENFNNNRNRRIQRASPRNGSSQKSQWSPHSKIVRDCVESIADPAELENGDMMEIICSNRDAMNSCLDQQQATGQPNHLKIIFKQNCQSRRRN